MKRLIYKILLTACLSGVSSALSAIPVETLKEKNNFNAKASLPEKKFVNSFLTEGGYPESSLRTGGYGDPEGDGEDNDMVGQTPSSPVENTTGLMLMLVLGYTVYLFRRKNETRMGK
jgi:hypothetical protein